MAEKKLDIQKDLHNTWQRPWDIPKNDDLYNRDERFFAILMKGTLNYLNNHLVMYGKPINHFILDTGSAYLYLEKNGYDFSWTKTSGNDTIYQKLPRCIVELGNITIPTEDLSQPFSRGVYERRTNNTIKGYNADIRRMPIQLSINCKYVFSNFNEAIIFEQEIIDKLLFQRYFNITYLGQIIPCSIEFPADSSIEFDNVDLASTEVNHRKINISLNIRTNYPIINTRTEESNEYIISALGGDLNITEQGVNHPNRKIIDTIKY